MSKERNYMAFFFSLFPFIFMGYWVFVLGSSPLRAQQFPYFVNIQENAFLFNPAITNVPLPVEDQIRPIPKDQIKYIFTGNGRVQWAEFGENSPKTYTASFQGKLSLGRAFLWAGPFFVKDQIGPAEFTSAGAKASVHLYLSDEQYIQAGISLQFLQYRLDTDALISRDLDDPTLVFNTDLEYQSLISPSIGLFYTNPYFYAGISAPYLTLFDPGVALGFSNQLSGIAGGFLTISRDIFKMEPYISYQRAQNFPERIDGGLKLWFFLQDDTPIWVGGGYNNNNHYRVEIGFLTDSNPNMVNSPPYFKINFAYGNQVGLAAPLGNVIEGGINIMLP